MTVLVTGGAGYIGSHVVLTLRDRGRPCVVVDDLSTGSRSLVPRGVELISGDVGDAVLIGRLIEQHKITSIVHLAASTSVPFNVAGADPALRAGQLESGALIRLAA